MELYDQVLCEAIAREMLPMLREKGPQMVEMRCFEAIRKIHQIVAEERLDDPECFERIEEIACVLDELGIGGGGRHDF